MSTPRSFALEDFLLFLEKGSRIILRYFINIFFIMSKPTYNLLNQQSLLKSNASKEEKILAQAKLEVFETLGLNKRKPMKIEDIAYQIFESRKKTGNIPNEIIINGNILTVNQNSYRSIFDSYHYFL